MTKLTNKTLFISGASRGIGLAIAKRAAKDGANIILAAKTAEPHPKLPGTIYTAAEEIELAHHVQNMKKLLETPEIERSARNRHLIKIGKRARDRMMAALSLIHI